MKKISDTQKVQEEEYNFPHHFVPQYKKDFSTAVYYGFGINYVSTIEFLVDKLNEIKFLSICDIGTGDGRFAKELTECFPDRKVYGLDYSERAINLARGLNPPLKFIRADILNDAIKEKFDVLSLIEVFEHIPIEEAEGFVLALHGLLSKNGILLVTVPHINQPLTSKHYQHFTSLSLKTCFKSYFSVEEEVFFEKPGHWRVYIIRRLMKNKLFILNNKRILNWIYKTYKKRCFYSEEKDCGRIYLKLRKKEVNETR